MRLFSRMAGLVAALSLAALSACLEVEFETTEYVLGENGQVDLNPPNQPGLDVVRLGSGRDGAFELEVYCTDLTAQVFEDGSELEAQTGSFLRFSLELAGKSTYDVTLDRSNARDCRVVLYEGDSAE